MKYKGYALAALSAASYGMNPFFAVPFLRRGMELGHILFYRFFIASLLIGLFLMITRVDFRVSRRELLVLSLLGVLFFLSSLSLYWSFRHIPAGIASTVLFVYPIFVALIMGFHFRERITWVTWTALSIAFAGVAFLSADEFAAGDAGFHIWGLAAVLVSAITYALYIVVVNKSCVSGMDGPKLTLYAMSFCALLFLIETCCSGSPPPLPELSILGEVVVFATVTTVISCISMVYAVRFIGSTPTAIMGALEPVVAMLVGVFRLGERFTLPMAVGISLIIGAVCMIVLSEHIVKKNNA